jgi:hypothetical protein
MSNPNGIGGFQAGHAPLSSGRPKSVSQIQLYALGRCREAIDVATRVMREPKDGDNVRLRACELILDRGVGKPNQSVALDLSLTKSLETMDVEELRQFRERYAAVVSASPALITHVLETDQAEQLSLLDGEDVGDRDGAVEASTDTAPIAPSVLPEQGPPRGRVRRRRRVAQQSGEDDANA